MRHAATEKRKQQNNDHDETPRAARPPAAPGPTRPTIDIENWLARYLSGTEKCHCNTAVRNRSSRGKRRGEARERSFMRTCGAEKLPKLVIEVEFDPERTGCFAERQLRFGLVVDGAVIKTSIQMGRPARGTQTSGRVRVSSW